MLQNFIAAEHGRYGSSFMCRTVVSKAALANYTWSVWESSHTLSALAIPY